MAKLTYATLKAMKLNQELSDGGARGGGTLLARRTNTAVLFYFRYTTPDGLREKISLGNWSGSGGELSLADARAKALELSTRYRSGAKDLKDVLELEEREAQRQRANLLAAEERERAKQSATLGALMNAYALALRQAGKSSAKEVEGAIKRHILLPWPQLAKQPAADITTDDLIEVISRVVRMGKAREADKLRSHISAAYNAAIKARQSPSAPAELRALKISSNPARDIATVENSKGERSRALSEAELRAYWRRIEAMDGLHGACLRFHLLTGGQRITQLSRLKLKDYDPDLRTVALSDPKGRRSRPRVHLVPLTDQALKALEDMAPARLGDYLVSLTCGQTGVDYQHLEKTLKKVVTAMEQAGELEQGPFTLGDLRRTVETRLAAKGVSLQVRAQLQSHGLSGVQMRHYDKHDYLEEKRHALETLWNLLAAEEKSNVIFLGSVRNS